MNPKATKWRPDAEIAYEAFAPAYDAFTAHHDFELWRTNLLPEVERWGLQGNRLLDVGCGTGKSFLGMLEDGWEVTACDISPAMIKLAREKVGHRAQLVVADMRALPTFGSFDLVWALTDAMNYLLSAGELLVALRGMRNNLAPTGLIVFDLSTLHTYRTAFAQTVTAEYGEYRLTWRGRATADTPPGSLCEAEISSEDASGQSLAPHVHRQRHFPMETVLGALSQADLDCLAVLGHGVDAVAKPLDELTHTKAMYIARLAGGQ